MPTLVFGYGSHALTSTAERIVRKVYQLPRKKGARIAILGCPNSSRRRFQDPVQVQDRQGDLGPHEHVVGLAAVVSRQLGEQPSLPSPWLAPPPGAIASACL